MTTTTTPRCDYRSDLGLGCARAPHAEGAHWLTASAARAHDELVELGFFRAETVAAAERTMRAGFAIAAKRTMTDREHVAYLEACSVVDAARLAARKAAAE